MVCHAPLVQDPAAIYGRTPVSLPTFSTLNRAVLTYHLTRVRVA